ncbi:DNA-processing protein DprA [Mycoplasma sp. 394]
MKDVILYFSTKFKGDQYQIYKHIQNGSQIPNKEIENIKNNLRNLGIEYKTIIENNYPKELYEINECVFAIYYRGNYDLVAAKEKFYIINELWDTYNWSIINKNLDVLVKEVVLITNDYKKTESEFVNLFRSKGGKIIHLAKEGLDSYDYRGMNLDNELVISQYPPDTHPQIKYFKQSNFIAATLAKCLLSLSLKKESKSNNLISAFLNLGKEIFCFPGSDIDDGNNQLIASGANLIWSISKVLNI